MRRMLGPTAQRRHVCVYYCSAYYKAVREGGGRNGRATADIPTWLATTAHVSLLPSVYTSFIAFVINLPLTIPSKSGYTHTHTDGPHWKQSPVLFLYFYISVLSPSLPPNLPPSLHPSLPPSLPPSHIYIYIHTYTYIYIYTCICPQNVLMESSLSVCMYVCMYVYTCERESADSPYWKQAPVRAKASSCSRERGRRGRIQKYSVSHSKCISGMSSVW